MKWGGGFDFGGLCILRGICKLNATFFSFFFYLFKRLNATFIARTFLTKKCGCIYIYIYIYVCIYYSFILVICEIRLVIP